MHRIFASSALVIPGRSLMILNILSIVLLGVSEPVSEPVSELSRFSHPSCTGIVTRKASLSSSVSQAALGGLIFYPFFKTTQGLRVDSVSFVMNPPSRSALRSILTLRILIPIWRAIWGAVFSLSDINIVRISHCLSVISISQFDVQFDVQSTPLYLKTIATLSGRISHTSLMVTHHLVWCILQLKYQQ